MTPALGCFAFFTIDSTIVYTIVGNNKYTIIVEVLL
jgi:hypothetical protein